MPGRPKKERRRDPSEAPKPTRMSKAGTVITCRICKLTGHNRSTCPNKNSSSTGAPSRRSTSHTTDMVVMSSTNAAVGTSKRSMSADRQGAVKKHKGPTNVTKSKASATTTGRKASLNLSAQVHMSQASSSVSVNVTSGSASGKVSAQDGAKRRKTAPSKFQDYLLPPPKGPATK